MTQFFKELFEYNHRMNQKLLETFHEHSDSTSEKSLKWINHILNAHQIWNNRIDKQQEAYGIWQIHSPGDLKEIDLMSHTMTLDLLERFDLVATINYTNTQGKAHTNSMKDILFHVINHSTYHRGQIASDFSQSGVTPLVTDYIAFKWWSL